MRRTILPLLNIVMYILSSGCGSKDVSTHSLKIVFPENDCRQATDFCSPWKGCYVLGIRYIMISVGDAHEQAHTNFMCDVDALAVNLKAYYYPGREPYNVELRYPRNETEFVVSKDGLMENDTLTPWEVIMK